MIGSEIYPIKGILVATQLLRQRSGRHLPYPRYGIETAQRDQSQEYDQTFLRLTFIPHELDLDNVETINTDQSQGAAIPSVKEGKIFILCYE